jgi:uncharacterized protein (DUF952 family)
VHAFHLTPAERWSSAPTDAPYAPASLGSEGFVHLTHTEDELLAAGDRHYTADDRPYVALVIDLDRLTVPWRYDGDARFPHAYGPLDRAAILEVRAVRRGDDGTFAALEAAEPAGSDE